MRRRLSSAAVLALFVAAVLGSSVQCVLEGAAVAEHKYVADPNSNSNPNQKHEHHRDRHVGFRHRRLLLGLGSAPPSCRSRCGPCRPCQPILVAIGPGQAVPLLEYYPEVWRCTCGDKLYVP